MVPPALFCHRDVLPGFLSESVLNLLTVPSPRTTAWPMWTSHLTQTVVPASSWVSGFPFLDSHTLSST